MGKRVAVLKLAALVFVYGSSAFWHHGHILTFIQQIAGAIPSRLGRAKSRLDITRRSSQLVLQPAGAPYRYELVVRRVRRALEIGLAFEGEASEAARYAEALAERALEIQARLGPRAQLEEQTRRRFRLYELLPVGTPDEWRPKRDLTPELAKVAVKRLARYVEVLEPMMAREGGGASARRQRRTRSPSAADAGAASPSARGRR